jgi:membrane protein implicated in regulation of membrane protease activity
VALLARSAGSLFAAFGLLAALAVLFAFAAFAAFAALTALTTFVTLWCAHRFVPEVGTLKLRNCDATGEGGSQCECSARNDRGDREGFAVLLHC